MIRLEKRHLRRANPESLRRFARWLGRKVTDEMSHNQVGNLIHWLLTRQEKKTRG